MKKIKSNVFCYNLYNCFNIYIIKGKDGDILIDTGFLFCKKKIRKILDNYNIKAIILTHAHIDHIWNTAFIKERYNCQVYISKNDYSNLDNSMIKSIPLNNKHILRTKMFHLGMKLLKQKPFTVSKKLKNEEIINICGIKFKIVDLKGHTEGSIGILYEDVLFVGDAIVNRKPYIELSYHLQNKNDSLKSVKKIISLNPKIICVGHEKPFSIEKLKDSMDRILEM